MKYRIVAEVREDHPSLMQGKTVYNDYVSRKSMMDFGDALNEIGYDCSFWGGMQKLLDTYLNHEDVSDSIFINYNYGIPAAFKRGQSPILLELMNAKYSGADPFTALLVNDKEYTKKVLRAAGVLSPRSILTVTSNGLKKRLSQSGISLPLVVKPNCEGSSLGITKESLCHTYEEAYVVACNLLPQFGEIIIEQYIAGYECTVWVIGNPGNYLLVAPLLISEKGNYFFEQKIFTMEDKANHVREYSLPEEILSNEVVEKIKSESRIIFAELGLRDYARIDFRISGNDIYFIEANALPIFSQTSEIGQISKLYGIEYKDICHLVIDGINTRLMSKAN